MRSIFRVGGCRRLDDVIDHAIKVPHDFAVCETQDTIASRVQIGCSFCVVSNSRISTMLVAVEFDNELCAVAAEVGDVFVKGCLATEMQTTAL